MRHFFVINPHSFKAYEKDMIQVLTEIESSFSGKDSDEFNTHISRYPRDAIAVVHRFIASCPGDETVRIYAVGGDGILFECLNGMVDFPNAELTSVPYGNANDFQLFFFARIELARRFRCPGHHIVTAAAMHVDHIHIELRQYLYRPLYSVRNIMEF